MLRKQNKARQRRMIIFKCYKDCCFAEHFLFDDEDDDGIWKEYGNA